MPPLCSVGIVISIDVAFINLEVSTEVICSFVFVDTLLMCLHNSKKFLSNRRFRDNLLLEFPSSFILTTTCPIHCSWFKSLLLIIDAAPPYSSHCQWSYYHLFSCHWEY
uniref:Uncharacterized protein n=1 Tax=Cacopsylla melanoneura TaxID=428564 RepID=A0A8D9B6P8_9HEMI